MTGEAAADALLQGFPALGEDNFAAGNGSGTITFSVGAEGAAYSLEGAIAAGQNNFDPAGSSGFIELSDDSGTFIAGNTVGESDASGSVIVDAEGVLGLGNYVLTYGVAVFVDSSDNAPNDPVPFAAGAGNVTVTEFSVTAVPEPVAATLALGMSALLLRRRV